MFATPASYALLLLSFQSQVFGEKPTSGVRRSQTKSESTSPELISSPQEITMRRLKILSSPSSKSGKASGAPYGGRADFSIGQLEMFTSTSTKSGKASGASYGSKAAFSMGQIEMFSSTTTKSGKASGAPYGSKALASISRRRY